MLNIGLSIKSKSLPTEKKRISVIGRRLLNAINNGLKIIKNTGTPICANTAEKRNLTKKSKFDTIIMR